MKTISLEAQMLSQKIGNLEILNKKGNRVLTNKGICDNNTRIVLVSLDEMSNEQLLGLSYFVDRYKRGEV